MSDWYNKINSEKELSQGDFILNCPIINPPISPNIEEWTDFEVLSYDIIVLTQSCDLQNKKISLVQVCPFFSLTDFCTQNPNFDNYKSKESIRRGYLPGYHLLNKCPFIEVDDFLIVDFKNTYSISFKFLENYKLELTERVQLLSPYKEHLSQSYARFFMRVGLPSDLPAFKKK